MRNALLIFAFLLASCASKIVQGIPGGGPDPYLTATPSLTPAPNVVVIFEAPRPTSTPFVYTIQSGDTFSQLAEKFKISQDELRAANPQVNPNSMPVGGTLLIPDASASLAAAGTPTPVPVPVTQVICHPSTDSGLWCFALIQNITPDILENVSAQINLLDENSNVVASQTAFTPLNIIPPDSAMPVYIFFPDTSAKFTPQVMLLSAMQLNANNARHLPAILNNIITQIRWDGQTAQVSGKIYLPSESKAATQVWIAAVAYDKDHHVVGLKRWEGGAIQPGAVTDFSFAVSSLAGGIDAVEFFVEAR
jgi:murein DD-endopeptidase MepM/ murein hydrolase activator NlpD